MSPLLIGRDPELDTLRSLVDGLGSGTGASVVIVGEPGIGKTALASAARDLAVDRGAWSAAGFCWEAGGAPPFWPWMQVVRSFVRGDDAERSAVAREHAGPGLAPLAGGDVGAVPNSGTEAEFRVFDALISFLGDLARERPLVVLLDDLQWADSASIRAAEFVARHLALSPVLLISTQRMLGDARDMLMPLAAVSTNLRLRGLDVDATADLVTGISGAPLSGARAGAIHAWTGGNPFFVQEAIRVEDIEGRPGSTSPVVRQILDRRVNDLAPEVLSVLQTAAVVGREFSSALVATLMSLAPGKVGEALRVAEAAGLVRTTTDDDASFVHDLVRESLQADLAPDQRRAVHAALVHELSSPRHGFEVTARALAEHAVSSFPDTDATVCADLLVAAAAEARAGHVPVEEADLLARALALLEPGSRPDLSVDVGNAMVRAGRLDDARSWFESLMEQARGHDADLFAGAALGRHQIGSAIEGPPDSVADDLAEAIESLRDNRPNDPKLARLLAARSRALAHAVGGDRALSDELSVEAVALARRAGDDATLGFCLLARHDAVWTVGTAAHRLALATEMSEVADRTGDVEFSLLAGHLRIVSFLELGRADAGGEHRANAALARAVRFPRAMYQSLTRAATFATLAGDFDRALALVDEAEELATRLDEPDRMGVSLDQRWVIAFLRGRPDDLEDDLARAHLAGDPHVVLLEALLAAQRGDADAVAARMDRVVELGEIWPRWAAGMWLVFRALLVTTADDSKQLATVREGMEPVSETWAVLGGAIAVFGPMRLWLATLAAAAADWDGAIESFHLAAESARRAGTRVWEVTAQIGLLEALAARDRPGDRDEANDLIEVLAEEPLVDSLAHARARLSGVAASMARPVTSATAQSSGVFRHEGDVWRLDFDHITVLVPGAKGLSDLHTLLANPNSEIPAIDLLHAGAPEIARAAGELGADPILDERARVEFRARLEHIDQELERALARHDDERAANLDDEREALLDELKLATGLGGRRRRLGDEAERARKTVSARIRDTLRRLDQRHPALADHLRTSIRLGAHCSYHADGQIHWEL